MDCSLPGSSVHRISQARILVWATISFSRGSSWWDIKPMSHISAGRFFTTESPGKPMNEIQFSSVQLLSRVRLSTTSGPAARQASLSITNSRSSLMGLVSYKKRLQKDPLALPTMKGHKKKPLAMSQEEGFHQKATMLTPWSWTSSL